MSFVPENFIKQRLSAVERAKERAEKIAKQQTVSYELKAHAIAAFKKYELEYATTSQNVEKARADAEAKGAFYVPAESKFFLVIRIKGVCKMSPQQKQIMQLFRLTTINSAVFIKCNKATLNALRYVAHYVTWGEPSVETIRKLIYAHGFCKIDKLRYPITDSNCVDSVLGKHSIRCVEDLVHEIATCGQHFKEANNYIWPFKLQARALHDKRVNFTEGGDFGFRGHYINEFVSKMI